MLLLALLLIMLPRLLTLVVDQVSAPTSALKCAEASARPAEAPSRMRCGQHASDMPPARRARDTEMAPWILRSTTAGGAPPRSCATRRAMARTAADVAWRGRPRHGQMTGRSSTLIASSSARMASHTRVELGADDGALIRVASLREAPEPNDPSQYVRSLANDPTGGHFQVVDELPPALGRKLQIVAANIQHTVEERWEGLAHVDRAVEEQLHNELEGRNPAGRLVMPNDNWWDLGCA
eukprot:NODE_9055_length_1450_cov_1.736206.p1 GENE.NODE_9055_length_1450_cov_1.736206~~NODE_9055_length_1450_cov_1.736206.p1  ORF type:complete len:238 (-),score=40.84 NODE_9055_length_1450_cov_1.736206:24-737(-)